MFLNTTLYLVGHCETVKSQGNKSGRNRQPVKICFRQSHTDSQQNNAVFRLERFTEVGEFTYLGKHFPCVNAN